ncbi:uncharacterized protein KLLA0_C00242g [Kluyveromyces lactis]|uniref:KLLA0C00242p n=1 Tax=Kluyveromyces lactis (strain ATCC 8585 / CBS 2359 / DSM 70799 / NBRC 1267 / NRRL Y-1140 / WM37) TaxID=284590 RepID=Q6CV34_KLULA|nr:uncharacterized protein KLLA0_C00242g [Kluyveromyces lactis]CAH01055.1 KLLA0C00242p [Kluyveromyces lactis]|eukprot:XP_452205.1 uncharacterized protein KLLA0_C00242g [Kluyveromyces lactis]
MNLSIDRLTRDEAIETLRSKLLINKPFVVGYFDYNGINVLLNYNRNQIIIFKAICDLTSIPEFYQYHCHGVKPFKLQKLLNGLLDLTKTLILQVKQFFPRVYL